MTTHQDQEVNIPTKKRGQYNKKADLNSKQARYALAVAEGNTKIKSLEIAGYAKHYGAINRVENSATFRAVKEKYADTLFRKITPEIVVDQHIKLLMQDDNLNMKAVGVKMAIDAIDNSASTINNDADQVTVILRQ